jgi:hypothetical protein
MIGLQYAWRSVLAGRLLLLFLLVTLVPAGALIVLGLRLASQDRVLLGQRMAELRPQSLDHGTLGNWSNAGAPGRMSQPGRLRIAPVIRPFKREASPRGK